MLFHIRKNKYFLFGWCFSVFYGNNLQYLDLANLHLTLMMNLTNLIQTLQLFHLIFFDVSWKYFCGLSLTVLDFPHLHLRQFLCCGNLQIPTLKLKKNISKANKFEWNISIFPPHSLYFTLPFNFIILLIPFTLHSPIFTFSPSTPHFPGL